MAHDQRRGLADQLRERARRWVEPADQWRDKVQRWVDAGIVSSAAGRRDLRPGVERRHCPPRILRRSSRPTLSPFVEVLVVCRAWSWSRWVPYFFSVTIGAVSVSRDT